MDAIKLTITRALVYAITSALGLAATAIAAKFATAGWFAYDAATKMVSVTFSIETFAVWAAGSIMGLFGGGLAFTAVLRKWGVVT